MFCGSSNLTYFAGTCSFYCEVAVLTQPTYLPAIIVCLVYFGNTYSAVICVKLCQMILMSYIYVNLLFRQKKCLRYVSFVLLKFRSNKIKPDQGYHLVMMTPLLVFLCSQD